MIKKPVKPEVAAPKPTTPDNKRGSKLYESAIEPDVVSKVCVTCGWTLTDGNVCPVDGTVQS